MDMDKTDRESQERDGGEECVEIPSIDELSYDEINAVLVHKWYLSERAGYDVGMECAAQDFFINHSRKWREERMRKDFAKQKEEILRHKWFLSEKRGFDIGMQEAALDWIQCGLAEHWRNKTGPYKEPAGEP